MAINAGRHPILESLHNDFVVSSSFVIYSSVFTSFVCLFHHKFVDWNSNDHNTVYIMQPNNLFLSEASNMVLVMGPNMCVPYTLYPNVYSRLIIYGNSSALCIICCCRSGKSTYLQQICLIVILAQIGCYVPAQFASLRVVDRVFTRIGTGDNVENNSSTVCKFISSIWFILMLSCYLTYRILLKARETIK